MKKIFINLFFLICLFSALLFISFHYSEKDSGIGTFYLNAYDTVSYAKLKKLAQSIEKEGFRVKLSAKDHFQSGLINIYASEDFANLPPVLDEKTINFLWLPFVSQNETEKLRPFDVIVVKSMPSFLHLKAINVRTAYIPDAIDISAEKKEPINKDYPMYYGDNDLGFSLALFLAGPTNLKIDVYGEGFSGVWPENSISQNSAQPTDFQQYPLVLADQSDEDIYNEIVNQRIITIIENGGLPYVRYNSGIEKMFGDVIPMYHNKDNFLPGITALLRNPQEILNRRTSLLQLAKQWSSENQAKKFIELADIMKRKLISQK